MIKNFGLNPRAVNLTPGPYAHHLAEVRQTLHEIRQVNELIGQALSSKHLVQSPEFEVTDRRL